MTHICVDKLTIFGSDNGLSPDRRQAIIWTNAGILLIRTIGTNFSEMLSEIHTFSFRKMDLKASSAKWRPFCLGLMCQCWVCVRSVIKIDKAVVSCSSSTWTLQAVGYHRFITCVVRTSAKIIDHAVFARAWSTGNDFNLFKHRDAIWWHLLRSWNIGTIWTRSVLVDVMTCCVVVPRH